MFEITNIGIVLIEMSEIREFLLKVQQSHNLWGNAACIDRSIFEIGVDEGAIVRLKWRTRNDKEFRLS
jgi:hypothetical protein